MLREALLALAVLTAPLGRTDFEECKTINSGPVVKQTPPMPFQRQPDLASVNTGTGYGTIYSHDMPPMRYRGNNTATAHFASHAEITHICAEGAPPPPPGKEYTGCVKSDGAMWLINPCSYPEQDYALTVCHELGHRNGWPSDHPL